MMKKPTIHTGGKKDSIIILGIASLFAIGSIVITGCGSSEQNNKEETQEHAKEHEHHDGDGVTGGHHDHGEHSHASGGHMDHMNEVRDWLKQELADKYDEPVPPATEEQLALGKETFTRICATCHGNSGKGDGPAAQALEPKPADFTDNAHSKYYSDMGRLYIIKKGVQGTSMVGWESTLNENEIQWVYAYVRSLRSSDEADGHDHGDGMYTCSMHPEVSGNKGDKCPKCGMDLIPKKNEDDGHNHQH